MTLWRYRAAGADSELREGEIEAADEAAAIERLHATGLSVLLVEQYLDLALRLADRFLILDAGHVVHSGRPRNCAGREFTAFSPSDPRKIRIGLPISRKVFLITY